MEMYGIYLSITHWRVWLSGYFFIVLSDHESLSVSTQSNNSRRIKKWLLGLSEYKYVIKYRRGILHRAPDALSRAWTPIDNDDEDETDSASVHAGELEKQGSPGYFADKNRPQDAKTSSVPYPEKDESETIQPVDMSGADEDLERFDSLPLEAPEEIWDDQEIVLPTKEQWAQATLRCRELAPIARMLNHELMDDFVDRVEAKSTIDKFGLTITNGIIIDKNGIKWVPEDYRSLVCDLFHSTPFAMHHDATRTIELLTRVVYWPDVNRDVRARVASCPECAVVKGRVFTPALQVKQIEARPFECMAMDHAGPFPRTSTGKRYMLVIVDIFSGYPEAFALSDLSAKATAEALIAHFSRFGWPRTILSDNGSAFKNELLREMCKRTGVRHAFTTVRHPQANGAAERLIGTIKRAMETLQAKYTTDWERKLNMILLAIRQTPKAPLWLSPSQIIFGTQMKGPLEREISWDPIELTPVQDWVFQRLRAYRETRLELSQALTEQRQKQADKSENGKSIILRQGDLVLVFNPLALVTQTHGIRFKWKGPYVVHRQNSAVNYSIYEDGELKTYHLSRLLPYDPRGVTELGHVRERINELRKEYTLFLRKVIVEAEISKKTHIRETAPEHKKRLQQISDRMGKQWHLLGQLTNPIWERTQSTPSPVLNQRGDHAQTIQDEGTSREVAPPSPQPMPHFDRPSPSLTVEEKGVRDPPSRPIEDQSPSLGPIPEITTSSGSDVVHQPRKATSELDSQPKPKRNKHLVKDTVVPEPVSLKFPFGIIKYKGKCFLGQDLGSGIHLYQCGGRMKGVFVPRYLDPQGNVVSPGSGKTSCPMR